MKIKETKTRFYTVRKSKNRWKTFIHGLPVDIKNIKVNHYTKNKSAIML